MIKPPPRGASVTIGDAAMLGRRLPAASVDLVLTSPPYWGLRTYGLKHDESVLEKWIAGGQEPLDPPPFDWYRDRGGVLGLQPYPEWFTAHLAEIFDVFGRALRPQGSLWVNLGDTYFARWSSIREDGRQGIVSAKRSRRRTPSGGWRHDKQLLLVPARFAIAMQDRGWILRNDLIWRKSCVAPRPERDRLRLSHEHWFHFVKRAPRGRPAYYYELEGAEEGAFDVVEAPVDSRNSHTASFGPQIIVPRILTSSPPGGLVVDPFCGSGTTLVAAVQNGRRAIGFDVQEGSVLTARARVAQAERESSLAS